MPLCMYSKAITAAFTARKGRLKTPSQSVQTVVRKRYPRAGGVEERKKPIVKKLVLGKRKKLTFPWRVPRVSGSKHCMVGRILLTLEISLLIRYGELLRFINSTSF